MCGATKDKKKEEKGVENRENIWKARSWAWANVDIW